MVGPTLLYLFFIRNPDDVSWIEAILALIGGALTAVPVTALALLSYAMIAGIAMLAAGTALKILVMFGRLGKGRN